ncbi:MAG: class II D-tagatose-bisphosphate aldolase, non-catalytic subunit [Elusimicrobiales bacterium]|jgi:hypothetical protein
MIRQKLESVLNRRCTLLGVGPMSANCVDAAIELANTHSVPLLLIASRRQVDSAEFGGGYVNNWTTEKFARYVIDRDDNDRIILARDHGGPWQSEVEKKAGLSLRRAMESAKSSYRADIDAGFQILHIDPSLDIHEKPTRDDVLDRVYELYEFCCSYAQEKGRKVLFEIGTEEQSGSTSGQEELEYTLASMRKFCDRSRLPYPGFVVIQTGTRVVETRNVGSLDTPIRVANELPAEIQVPKMIEICNKYRIFMKEHNTDYLSDESLQWHPRLGIHAANVAPEFGVTETRALLEILENNGLRALSERFLRLSYESGKWEKWMLSGTKATEKERAVISGHYVFSHPECVEIKNIAREKLKAKGGDLEAFLRGSIGGCILRYMRDFRLVRGA